MILRPYSRSRRDFLISSAAMAASLGSGGALAAAPRDKIPLAISGTNWQQKSNWNFGTSGGIGRFTDWLKAGWFMTPTPTFLNKECETYSTTNSTDGNPNFQAFWRAISRADFRTRNSWWM
jgi:hypothetical protein